MGLWNESRQDLCFCTCWNVKTQMATPFWQTWSWLIRKFSRISAKTSWVDAEQSEKSFVNSTRRDGGAAKRNGVPLSIQLFALTQRPERKQFLSILSLRYLFPSSNVRSCWLPMIPRWSLDVRRKKVMPSWSFSSRCFQPELPDARSLVGHDAKDYSSSIWFVKILLNLLKNSNVCQSATHDPGDVRDLQPVLRHKYLLIHKSNNEVTLHKSLWPPKSLSKRLSIGDKYSAWSRRETLHLTSESYRLCNKDEQAAGVAKEPQRSGIIAKATFVRNRR